MNVDRQTPRMAREIIEREMKERTGKLILSDCGLIEIPREVFEMDWLEELVITNGYITEEEKAAQQKKQTKKAVKRKAVYREPNILSEIPRDIIRLKDLKILIITPEIGEYKTEGVIWEIKDISPLTELKGLEYIDLSKNRISDIGGLRNLKNLQFLDLSSNGISILPFPENLDELQSLILQNNDISDISFAHDLKKINSLDLSYNDISDISFLSYLKNLKSLNLDFNKISDISTIVNLEKLESLNLSQNSIRDITPLAMLYNLHSLTIESNWIKEIEPLINVPKLKVLFIEGNNISDCPPEVWQTNDIQQIRAFFEGRTRDITSNIQQEIEIQPNLEIPSSNIPPIFDEQTRDILDGNKNFEDLFEEKDEVKPTPEIDDVKLIFVGNSGAGKTQLSKFFENGKLDKKRETTHGIRLNRWLPKGKVSPAFKSLKDKVAANIWDFGGQEYYHGTFRLFLSNHAVYILLWETDTNRNDIISTEVREEDSEDLQHYHYKYWLDNIRHFAPDSPILIVQNKVDKDQRQRISTTWIDEYNIFGDHHISLHEAAKTGTSKYKWSFDTFCNDLSDCFDEILKRKAEQKRSIAWLKIRDAVVEVSKAKRKNSKNPFSKHLKVGKSINIKDFEKACLEIEPELTENETYTMPRWLHNSGLVIYFGNDEILNDTVYLDPIWVTTGIYKILNETVRARSGVFSKKDIHAKKGLDEETVLALMKEMEIVFEKVDEPDTFVAPQYLPETHPVEDLYAIAANGMQQKAYYVRLPLYFFRKVLQRMIFFYGMSQNVDAKYYWKQGILFEKKGTKVMFKGIMPSQESDSMDDQSMDNEHGVFLIGAQPSAAARDIQKEVFHIIAEILDEKDLTKIHRENSGLEFSLNEQKNLKSKIIYSDIHHRANSWTTKYEKEDAPRWLKKMEVSTNGEDFVNYLKLCNENRKESVFIKSIPNKMFDVELAPEKRLRIHDFELLLDDQPQRPLKVFFSYSHKDTAIMNQLAVHLAPLKRLEKIETWSDKAIQAGDEWDESIKSNLRNSDIILFLVSADFIASSYIWEKEIPLAMELKNNSSERVKRVIPIYLRPFDFSGLAFSDMEMIPKEPKAQQLKAISQWENTDEAFMEVAKSIREVIENTK